MGPSGVGSFSGFNIGALIVRIGFPLKGSLKGSIRSGRDLL